MKARAFLLLAVPAICLAQGPAITFEKLHHDFGKISPDRKISYRFKVTNTGGADLTLADVAIGEPLQARVQDGTLAVRVEAANPSP